MYEGCNKTAIASQAAIAEALIELMKDKPYSRISVSEICKRAGVSRQTFYSLFASKDNVISFILERKYCFRPQDHECCRSSMTLEDICRAYSQYITERRDMIVLLVRNSSSAMIFSICCRTVFTVLSSTARITSPATLPRTGSMPPIFLPAASRESHATTRARAQSPRRSISRRSFTPFSAVLFFDNM